MTRTAWPVAMLAMALASIAACQRNETSAPAPVATGAPAIKPPAGATETGAAPAATVLLIRMHNKQRQAATFADENFRLLTKDSVIPANGGLSETIEAGADSTLERVQFVVPLGSAPRALKIEHDGEAIEVPIGLK